MKITGREENDSRDPENLIFVRETCAKRNEHGFNRDCKIARNPYNNPRV